MIDWVVGKGRMDRRRGGVHAYPFALAGLVKNAGDIDRRHAKRVRIPPDPL